MDRIAKIRSLIVMAAADGRITEEEIALLAQRCENWGISEIEFADAISYALSDDAHVIIPESKVDCYDLLRDLLRVMAADGYLADAEKKLFALAAAQMNISDHEVDELIDSMM